MTHFAKDLSHRRHERIDFQRSGFIIPAPDAPWIECFVNDVSESGLCLDIGSLKVPETFAVAFTRCGTVRRVMQADLAQRRVDRRALRHGKGAPEGSVA
jgi:hypothetical protein